MAVAGSVIVRVKNEAGTIGRTLEALRGQTVAVELIVVDSGSTDGTREVARRLSDRLIDIAPERFTFGRALNLGADAASAPIHFALSAHCRPERPDWVERSLAHYERSDVAATNGNAFKPDGSALRDVLYQDAAITRAHPLWGFSNHAASWRAEVWTEFPFNESMAACEDKEWSWRVLNAGWLVAHDPFLQVSTAHRERSGVKAYYGRVEREARELAAHINLPAFDLTDALGEWWNGYPPDNRYPPLFHRANYYRIAEIAGRYVGDVRGRRRRVSGAGERDSATRE
jgi:rhamnosyltransferase